MHLSSQKNHKTYFNFETPLLETVISDMSLKMLISELLRMKFDAVWLKKTYSKVEKSLKYLPSIHKQDKKKLWNELLNKYIKTLIRLSYTWNEERKVSGRSLRRRLTCFELDLIPKSQPYICKLHKPDIGLIALSHFYSSH